MKIAIPIISLILFIIIVLQFNAGEIGTEMAEINEIKEIPLVVILVLFSYISGGILALKLPKIAAIFFMLAGTMGVAAGKTTIYNDLQILGWFSIILSIMSYIPTRKT